MAIFKIRLGQDEEALAVLTRAIAAEPMDAVLNNHLGNVYRRLGDYETAELYLIRSLEIEPVYAEAHNNLGVLHFYQGRYEEAKKAYETA